MNVRGCSSVQDTFWERFFDAASKMYKKNCFFLSKVSLSKKIKEKMEQQRMTFSARYILRVIPFEVSRLHKKNEDFLSKLFEMCSRCVFEMCFRRNRKSFFLEKAFSEKIIFCYHRLMDVRCSGMFLLA